MQTNLPLNWCESTLDDIAEYLNGLAFKPSDWKETGLPIIRIQNLTNPKKEFNYTTKKFKNEYLINRGDILLSWSATLDVFIWQRENAWLNQHIFKVTPKKHMNDRFVFYILKNALYELIHSEFLHGSTMKHINRGPFLRHKILLPPLAEQERIVEKIEALFKDIDEGVERLKSAQAQIKQYRQSVLKSAFEGKLYKTTDWKEVDITKIIAKEKNALKAGPFGSALKKEIYVEKGYKIYGQEQVIAQNPFYGDYYINEEKYLELASCKVQPNDILISLVGTIGKVLILPNNIEKGIINPRLLKVTLDTSTYLPLFFKFYFESQYLRSLFKIKAHGATMDVLNLSILKELPFPLPTLPEQQRIVEEIEKRFAVADELEKAVNEGLEKADKLKQSILKKAFEGKLVAQNPNDEPAYVLLERIKKEQIPTKGKKK